MFPNLGKHGIPMRMPEPPSQSRAGAFSEPFYTVEELAALWKLSDDTIRRLFRDEPGVLVLGREKRPGKRRHMTLRIPESVALRVLSRLSLPKSD